MTAAAATLEHRNRKVGLYALLGALAMLGLGYASVPLYRLFCQVTGFGGTTMRVTEAEAGKVALADGTISIRFDANVDRNLGWEFRPERNTDTAQLGGRRMAIYVARNLTDKPITGMATFNVTPEAAGKYFNKIQCFCFNEQTLQPGQEVRMPVIYYVDPAIRDDEDAKAIEQITLSYTFHRQPDVAAAETASKPLDRARSGG
jgi:cytochrome c oxidase assembly protein subunit 11